MTWREFLYNYGGLLFVIFGGLLATAAAIARWVIYKREQK